MWERYASRSIRQTKGVINQLRRQRERNQNLRKMLLAHMPYVYNAYKLEEVETVGFEVVCHVSVC